MDLQFTVMHVVLTYYSYETCQSAGAHYSVRFLPNSESLPLSLGNKSSCFTMIKMYFVSKTDQIYCALTALH
jgi:hypothetical protein